MSQPGGAANINGILYQILGALEWASRIQLNDANLEGQEITRARLIIEPSGGGGDAQLYSPGKRLVGQWKTKGDGGPWSLQRVIDDVIPDLYRAVNERQLDDQSTYLFITEGSRGRWDKACTLLGHLSRGMPPQDPLSALDGAKPERFFPQRSCTQQELFQTIAAPIRQHPQWCNEPEQLTYRKLWHLLARFQFEDRRTVGSLQRQIDEVLRDLVNNVDEIDDKRQQLCGILLELAAKGHATITPDDLLRKAGLSPLSFRQWSLIKIRLRRYLDRELYRKGYRRELDVRPSLSWPESSSVLVVTGESGHGKTWRLARLASKASFGEGLVAFITSRGDVAQDLSAVADTLWNKALARDLPLTIDRIAERRRYSAPEVAEPWATVCIDDVQSVTRARRLLQADWEAWGIRLAMTVSPVVGRALKSQNPERVHLIELGDFTLEELRNYLQCRHRDWGTIPQDVRKVLRRPLLAKLYCELDPSWTPKNEYALFERYWHRIQTEGDQADFLQDTERMRKLAVKILQQDARYPWDFAVLEEVGITEGVVKRLESIGWLRRVSDNQFEIWHDRLLNWAVAEALVVQRQAGRITLEDLTTQLAVFQDYERKFAGKFLGYVPMDVLWLASDPSRGLPADVPHLIAALENHQTYGGYPESLYRDLLPTLGERVIRALVERLWTTSAQKFSGHGQLVSTALVRIANEAPEEVRACVAKLLNDPLSDLQHTGMRVLARVPSAAALDQLWELHRLHVQRIREQQESKENDSEPYRLYDLSFSALRACIQIQPQWLVQKIYDTDFQHEPVWELAYLMANLEDFSAKELWREVKSILFKKIPSDRPRSLINCIRRFRDYDEIPRLEQWLTEKNDLASVAALAALATLDADRALMCLSGFPRDELYSFRGWWFPELLVSRRTELQARLFTLMRAPGADIREIAYCYQDYENEMDAATVDFLLDALEREINRHFDEETGEVTPRLSSWLELLARLAHAKLLERLQYKAGSKLEALLTTVACSRVGRTGGYFDHDLHKARLLLLKIGGSGITTLVNRELAHSDFHACLNGLTWALVKPDAETRRLLKAITESSRLTGTPPFPYEQLLATRALAALQEIEAVVESVLRWGLHMPADLTEWWEGHPPINDERLKKAIEALNSADENVKINALLVLGISGRQDLVPNIRQILSAARQESKAALAGMIALDELRDKSSDAVRLFTLQLSIPERSVRAINALLNVGTEEALKYLEQYLCTIYHSDFQQFCKIGAELALALSKYPLTRSAALKTLWPIVRDRKWLSWPSACFEAIGDLDDGEIREWLREEAFPTEGTLHDVPRTASVIRGLAKFDPMAAFQAARFALRQMHCDREALPSLLLELDPDNAIQALCEHAPIERYTLTRWAIGRSLRHAEKKNLVLENLEEMLQSSDPRVRQAGTELARWQNGSHLQEMLHKLCIDDTSDRVRRASREALLRRRDEEEVYRLMSAFRSADSDQQWRLLEAIIELGDPYLLNNKKDPLWRGQILDGVEIALVKHAEKRLKERVKDVQSQAEKIDREMERAT